MSTDERRVMECLLIASSICRGKKGGRFRACLCTMLCEYHHVALCNRLSLFSEIIVVVALSTRSTPTATSQWYSLPPE